MSSNTINNSGNSGSVNLSPDPNVTTVTLTVGAGGSVSSAISATATQNPNLNFDPNAVPSSSGSSQPYINSSNSAVSPNAPPAANNSSNINIQVPQRTDDMILTNILDNYIDVTYHITLGMVSNGAVQSLQNSGVNAQIGSSDYIIFASTGDNQTNSTAGSQSNSTISSNSSNMQYTGDYYNIQSLSFRSFIAHLPQNPLISAIVDGKMKIYEPYGFQLREDINDMAQQLGYTNLLSPVDYVYRLEVWFNGYDPITGNWIPQIGIPCPQTSNSSNTITSIVYFLVITAVEAKVTPSGTFYDLSFQTFSHYATRAENVVVHHDSYQKGSVNINGSPGDTFGQFLTSLGSKLNSQIQIDTQNTINVTFQFTGFEALFNSPFIDPVNVDFTTGVNFDSGSGSYAVSANCIDIFTLINNVMLNVQLVRSLLLQSGDANFTQPTVWWNIRPNITAATEGPQTPVINSNQNYTFQYIFEPVLTYRCRLPLQLSDWNTQTNSSNQNSRVTNMLGYSMLYRWYDYYFTSDNSEIIDFQFMFKNFYYMQIPYQGPEVTLRGQQANSPDLQTNNTQQLQNQAMNAQSSNIIQPPSINFTSSSTSTSQTITNLLSQASNPQDANSTGNNANPANQHQGRHRGPLNWVQGDYGAHVGAQVALAARDQYLRWDMLNAQMTVRFDPQWLLNPYMSGGDTTPTLPAQDVQGSSQFVYAHTDRMVYLNAYAPNQASYMNPNQSVYFIRKTPILGGFYQVLYVENEFNGGSFYQKLNMYKYDHLNYYNYSGGTNSQSVQYDDANTPSTQIQAASSGNGTITPDPNASNSLS